MSATSGYAYSHEYDVLVAGAGVAGVAAALAAARAGRSVALVEKTVLLGGLATTGLINIYLPICDGNGRQVCYGIAEELLHLSIRYGPGSVPAGWRSERNAEERRRFMTVFSPASFVLALDEIIEAARIDLWLDALVCQPVVRANRVEGLEIETKSGKGLLSARVVIDATGDADIAFRSGAPCAEAGNFLSLWAIGFSMSRAQQSVEQGSGAPFLKTVRVGADAFGTGQPPDVPPLYGTDARQVTAFVVDSRRRLRRHYQDAIEQRGEQARCEEFPLALPSMAQFRMTRRIDGQATMRTGEAFRRHEDSIGLSPDWRKPGPVWEIPYASLLPRDVRGLLAAGRCVSADGDAWEVMRVIPPAALTGEAAGVAAALAVERCTLPDSLDPKDVQARMRANGVRLHLDEIGL